MKKLLYLIVLLGAFFSFSFGNNMDVYQNNIKVKKLARLETQFLDYVQTRYDTVSAGITGLSPDEMDSIQAIFDEKMTGNEGVEEKLRSVFISMKYDSPKKDYNEYVSELKAALDPYKEIEAEIQNIRKNKTSSYILSGDEVSAVKAGVIEIQKAFVENFEKNVMENMLSYSGLQETGNMTFSVNTTYGNVVFKMSDYSTKMDFENNSQDISTKMNIDFDLTIPGEMESQSGSIYLDMYIVMKDKDMYMTINDYDVKLSNADAGLSQMLQMFSLMKGKTIHIPTNPMNSTSSEDEYVISEEEINAIENPMMSSFQGTNSMMFLKKTLDVLKTDSLFTPFRKTETGYKIMFDINTVEKIFDESNMSFSYLNSPIIVKENVDFNSEKGIYVNIDTATSKGEVSMNKEGTGFVLAVAIDGAGYASGNVFDMTWKIGLFKLDLVSEGININMNLENGKLDSKFDIMGSIIKIAGDYSKKLADLKILYNDTEIGYLKSTYDGKNGTYDMYLNLDTFKSFVEFLKSFEIKFTGDVTVNTGSVNVQIPTDYIEMDKLMQGYLTIAE